jgi:tRNA-specific 2-thiouridylase
VKKKAKVFVGVSGGVDSSVTLALLQKEGYDVTGVFIRTWQPDFIVCNWRDERRDAIRVCAALSVPFLECDAEEAYKKEVADYMIAEYKRGRTPNPDVMCNRNIKFGVFWQFAKAHGADCIATGHYAQIKKLKAQSWQLKASPDLSKDQSYFLWTLTQEDLAHTLFPIGEYKKEQVRKLAEKFKLPTATKKDSQGICMLGPLDTKEFLKHYIKEKPGDVLNSAGKKIGTHSGAWFLTYGERHGFTVTEKTPNDAPYYIVGKDVVNNTLIVSTEPEKIKNDRTKKIILEHVNLVSGSLPLEEISVVLRYHGEQFPCALTKKNQKYVLEAKKAFPLVAPGQSAVLFHKNVCLGGGIVASF